MLRGRCFYCPLDVDRFIVAFHLRPLQHWDGTGGNGAALRHFEATGRKYPLAVKLGTITPTSADVYSYAPDEDDMVTDPKLAEHLAHWGINILQMEKTEKTMTELQIQKNIEFEANRITEEGERLEPLHGPGYVDHQQYGRLARTSGVAAPKKRTRQRSSTAMRPRARHSFAYFRGHALVLGVLPFARWRMDGDSMAGIACLVSHAHLFLAQAFSLVRTRCRYTGLTNLGNSCYMNSVLQVLWSLKETGERYLPHADAVFGSAPRDVPGDLLSQWCKVGRALVLAKTGDVRRGEDGELKEADAVRPGMFKALVGRGHTEFSSNRQQVRARDAGEAAERVGEAQNGLHFALLSLGMNLCVASVTALCLRL